MDKQKLAMLAESRQALVEAMQTMREIEEEAKRGGQYQLALSVQTFAQQNIDNLTAELQAEALAEYQATSNKKPEGATVKIFTVLKYDVVAALEWARKELPEALTLDKKLFETHAKGVAKTKPIPVVEIVEEARAQIAGDLSEYLPASLVEEEK